MERGRSVNKVWACFQSQHHKRAGADAGKMPNVFILARLGVSSVFLPAEGSERARFGSAFCESHGSVTSPQVGMQALP